MAKRLVHPGDRVYFKPMRGNEVPATLMYFTSQDSAMIQYERGKVVVRLTVKISALRLHK